MCATPKFDKTMTTLKMSIFGLWFKLFLKEPFRLDVQRMSFSQKQCFTPYFYRSA